MAVRSSLRGWSPVLLVLLVGPTATAYDFSGEQAEQGDALVALDMFLGQPYVEEYPEIEGLAWEFKGVLNTDPLPAGALRATSVVLELVAAVAEVNEPAEDSWSQQSALASALVNGGARLRDPDLATAIGYDGFDRVQQIGALTIGRLAGTVAARLLAAANAGAWDDVPLTETQIIKSLDLSAQAFVTSGDFALAGQAQAGHLQRKAVYDSEMEAAAAAVRTAEATLAARPPGLTGGFADPVLALRSVVWSGDLGRSIVAVEAAAEDYGRFQSEEEPAANALLAELRDANAAAVVAWVSFLGLLVVASFLACGLLVVGQNRWARDLEDAALGQELLWRPTRVTA